MSDLVLTNAGPCRDGRLADPERDPGENNQQNRWNICLQDKEQHIPTQGKMQYQLGVLSWEKKQLLLKDNSVKYVSIVLCRGTFGDSMLPTCFIHSLRHCGVVALYTVLSQTKRIQTPH